MLDDADDKASVPVRQVLRERHPARVSCPICQAMRLAISRRMIDGRRAIAEAAPARFPGKDSRTLLNFYLTCDFPRSVAGDLSQFSYAGFFMSVHERSLNWSAHSAVQMLARPHEIDEKASHSVFPPEAKVTSSHHLRPHCLQRLRAQSDGSGRGLPPSLESSPLCLSVLSVPYGASVFSVTDSVLVSVSETQF